MPDKRTAIVLREVAKTFRTRAGVVHALRGVDAELADGSFSVVAGPSGSGKSTLLRILAGLERPDRGDVRVGAVELARASARQRRRLRRHDVAFVFQHASDNFVPHLTVREHLRSANGRSGGVGPAEALELLEIADRRDHLASELSGGEQQRAAFARALCSGARFVVADEPTAEMDSASGAAVIRAIKALVQRGVTVVASSHDRAVIWAADSGIDLEDGRVRSRGGVAAEPRGMTAARYPSERSTGVVVLEMHDVRRTYTRRHSMVEAVRGVDLEVREREVVGLVGRSGSGKTTLLSIAAGFERADRGGASLDGSSTGDTPPSWDRLAIVPQRLGLMEDLSIRENIEYPCRLSGRLERDRVFVDDLLDRFGLDELQHRMPAEVSLGEQQRAAVARALILAPRLVLADEPTGHQDRGWTRRVLEVVREVAEEGTACLAASHDRDVAAAVDRVLTMADGVLVDAC